MYHEGRGIGRLWRRLGDGALTSRMPCISSRTDWNSSPLSLGRFSCTAIGITIPSTPIVPTAPTTSFHTFRSPLLPSQPSLYVLQSRMQSMVSNAQGLGPTSSLSFSMRYYQKSVTPTLYIAATPIGNLGDLTDRFKTHLEGIPNIICENTLSAARLLATLEVPSRGKKFIQYAESKRGDAFSEKKIQNIIGLLVKGQDCIYFSEAGCPCISDPGFQLVNKCLESGFRVSVLPGASSITSALMVSGVNANKFVFQGFFDKGQKKRLDTLKELSQFGRTVVAFENPTRLRQTLDDIASVYHPDTLVVVCKELTKKHEEVIRGKISHFRHLLPENMELKGEIVIVIGGKDSIDE